jgi:hypothetical protein
MRARSTGDKCSVPRSIASTALSKSPETSIHFSTNASPGRKFSGGENAARSANGSFTSSSNFASGAAIAVPSQSRTPTSRPNRAPRSTVRTSIERRAASARAMRDD